MDRNYKWWVTVGCALTLLTISTMVEAYVRYEGRREGNYRDWNNEYRHQGNWRNVNVNRNVIRVNNVNANGYYYKGQRYNYYTNGNYYNYYNNGNYYKYYNNGGYFNYFVNGVYYNYFYNGNYYNNCRKVPGYWSRGHWNPPTRICR